MIVKNVQIRGQVIDDEVIFIGLLKNLKKYMVINMIIQRQTI